MSSPVSARLRRLIADQAYHVCEYCLIHEDDSFWGCEVDHIMSQKHGGGSEPGNLAWSCALCNTNKGSDLGTMVGTPAQLTRIFHPRNDRWAEHFHLQHVRLEATDLVGQATVKLLHLNHESRVRERDALSLVGRYPTVEALARMKE